MSGELSRQRSVFERGRRVSLPRAKTSFTTTPSLFLEPDRKPELPDEVHTLPRGVWARKGNVGKTDGITTRIDKSSTKRKRVNTVWMPPQGQPNGEVATSKHSETATNDVRGTSSVAVFSNDDESHRDEASSLPTSVPAMFTTDISSTEEVHKRTADTKPSDVEVIILQDGSAVFTPLEVETSNQLPGGMAMFYEDHERPSPQQAVKLYTAVADEEVPRDWQTIAATFFGILNGGQSWIPPRVTLVTNYLLLGGFEAASDVKFLVEKKVTHVLNAAGPQTSTALRQLEQTHFTYLEIAADDSPAYDISQHFIRAHSFIERCRSMGGRVLVHCMAGINRSSALVLSHLLFEGHDLIQATDALKKSRGMFLTNPSFQMQILQLARQLGTQS